MVVPFMASPNRDPRQFPDPDTLDVRRHAERHVAFAWGIHFCLGAWRAPIEARVVLDTAFRRLPCLALASSEPRWKPMIFLRGLESLPLTWPHPPHSMLGSIRTSSDRSPLGSTVSKFPTPAK